MCSRDESDRNGLQCAVPAAAEPSRQASPRVQRLARQQIQPPAHEPVRQRAQEPAHEPVRQLDSAIEDLAVAARSGNAPADDDRLTDMLAEVWGLVAELDPELARRLDTYRG
jgi:hypothetical protein